MSDPFHAGERAIQERTGERATARLNGRMIAPSIPAGARAFVGRQAYGVLGHVSPAGDLWATFLTAQEGFASVDEAGTLLSLDVTGVADDLARAPSFCAIRPGDHLGLLFIDLATRRRLRVNGRVTATSPGRLDLAVDQSFPNCAKYIQRRDVNLGPGGAEPAVVRQGDGSSGEIVDWIAAADTFFVASAAPDGPVDASHRGGRAGFVRVADGVLRIPDYPGNAMFGTLGNFAVDPRAGLVFVDFAGQRQLQLSGDVRLDLDAWEAEGETGGTGRWWEFIPRRWIVSPLARPFGWTPAEASPFNP